MRFCSHCGEKVVSKIPPADNRERYVCDHCDTVHYLNPNTVVGTIPLWIEDGQPKVLLCKRNIEPRLGYWTLPAGFLELGETTNEGAIRETLEESCAELINVELYRIMHTFDRKQIHMYFRAKMVSTEFRPTTESSEVALYAFDEIPWRNLSFPSVYKALEDFVQDYTAGEYPVKMYDIGQKDWQKLDY
jgi:ADP-ribose pyrophosphatase YjhB (NUDIX family)